MEPKIQTVSFVTTAVTIDQQFISTNMVSRSALIISQPKPVEVEAGYFEWLRAFVFLYFCLSDESKHLSLYLSKNKWILVCIEKPERATNFKKITF